MADELDRACDLETAERESGIAAARVAAAGMLIGEPGMCEGCCDDSPRLVRMGGLLLCAPCRDKREKRR